LPLLEYRHVEVVELCLEVLHVVGCVGVVRVTQVLQRARQREEHAMRFLGVELLVFASNLERECVSGE